MAGASTSVDEAGVVAALRALASGQSSARYGLEDFPSLTGDEVRAAAALCFGWPGHPVARIDGRRTMEAAEAAAGRVREVAAAGGRIAFATARPASLLGLFQSWALAAAGLGAHVLAASESDEFRIDGRAGRRLRWVHGVAMVTDGLALIPVFGTEAAEEWMFTLARPALAVGDHAFAAVALHSGIETIAWAGLDAPVFAVAAARGLPCTVVPLDDQCPPAAYDPIAQLLP